MKIYTKGGDAGETGLYGGARVAKDDLRIRVYGTFDELNACLGLALATKLPKQLAAQISALQSELFVLGAELATPSDQKPGLKLLEATAISRLENEIDGMEAKLKPLKTFILPGGTAASAQLHLARTISRRAERELVQLHRVVAVRAEVLQYINRLSDHLFVCARFANHLAKQADVPWVPEK